MNTSSQIIELPSKAESLLQVEKLIDGICENFHINEDYYGNMLIAVTEAVNNAIQHGNHLDEKKEITVSFNKKDKNHLSFIIKDEGDGFNFDEIPDPTDPNNIEKAHGRGVFLMRHLADEVLFYDNGSSVELNFNLN